MKMASPVIVGEPSFFATLGALAGRQSENQLSRTFEACFRASQGFRGAVFSALRRTCGLDIPNASWVCRTEEAKNTERLDIKLQSGEASIPTIILENKVGSVLKLEQLQRYRTTFKDTGKVTHIVAVTKNRPEVPKQELRRCKFYAMRWQDLHRELRQTKWRSPIDRFITQSFADYLEGADMAYPEELTMAGLERAGNALRAINGTHTADGVSVKRAFLDLHACSGLMQELADDLREEFPRLAERAQWGPAIYRWDATPGDPYVGTFASFWTGAGRDRRSFGWGFAFGLKRPQSYWMISKSVGGHEEDQWLHLRTCVRKGVVDKELMLQRLREYARKWAR